MNNIIVNLTPDEKFRETVREEMRRGLEELLAKQKSQPQTNRYWSRKQTAEQLNITLPTLRAWTRSGKIKSYVIEGRVLYKPEEVDLALTQQTSSVRK